MAEKVVMIALSPTMDEGKIQSWKVQKGDSVSMGQVICEVETDKSSMEYESINEGSVLEILVPEGGFAKVGQTIAVFGETGEDISALIQAEQSSAAKKEPKKTAAPTAAPAEPGKTPSKKETAQPTAASTAISPAVQTSASTAASKASSDRIPKHDLHSVDQDHVRATPLARKRAAELNIDLGLVQGTGANGRIQRSDVDDFIGAPSSSGARRDHKVPPARTGAKKSSASPVSAVSQFDVPIPVEGVRAVIAERLSASMFSAPHFYVKSSMRTEQLLALRAQALERLPVKLSLNAFIIKLLASAIQRNPRINSSWNEDGGSPSIVHHSSIDIALAVDLGNGLITPVLRDCYQKSVEQLDQELQALIEKVRTKTIMPEEYSNATFTVSNLGSFGVEEFTAIINPPSSCILAVGKNQKVPIVNSDGQIVVGAKMICTLSSDHRVIDGIVAAKFMSDFKDTIENPALAVLL